MMLTGAETQLAWTAAWLIPSILAAATAAQVTTGAIGAADAKSAQKKQLGLQRQALSQRKEEFDSRYPEVGDEGAQTAARMAEQRRRQQRYGGRASTILTSPLGVAGGQTPSGAKTLTGT